MSEYLKPKPERVFAPITADYQTSRVDVINAKLDAVHIAVEALRTYPVDHLIDIVPDLNVLKVNINNLEFIETMKRTDNAYDTNVYGIAMEHVQHHIREVSENLHISTDCANKIPASSEDIEFMELKLRLIVHDLFNPIQSAVDAASRQEAELYLYELKQIFPRFEDLWTGEETFHLFDLKSRVKNKLSHDHYVSVQGTIPSGHITFSGALFDALLTNVYSNAAKAHKRRRQITPKNFLPFFTVTFSVETTRHNLACLTILFDDEGTGFPMETIERGTFIIGDKSGYGSREIRSNGLALGTIGKLCTYYQAQLIPSNRYDDQGKLQGGRVIFRIPFQ